MLNCTRCPAIIMEMDYISNATDRSWITSAKKKEIAASISAAIEHNHYHG
jgi:N-acetylmuramoyl-L-alanine amidase